MSGAKPLILTLDQLLDLLRVRADDCNAARLLSILEAEVTPFFRIVGSCAFRDAAAETARLFGHPIVLLDKDVNLQIPPPFHEHFEPIKFGSADAQAQLISGTAPTRQEKIGKVVGIAVPLMLLVVSPIWIPLAVGMALDLKFKIFVVFCLVTLVAGGIEYLRLRTRWFMVPRGVAIEETHGWNSTTSVVVSPDDAIACLCFDTKGDSNGLLLQLWSGGFKTWSRGISERDALTFLAAWQSTHPTPGESAINEYLRRD